MMKPAFLAKQSQSYKGCEENDGYNYEHRNVNHKKRERHALRARKNGSSRKKGGFCIGYLGVLFWNLMVYLGIIHVINWQTFFALTGSVAIIWLIIAFKLRGMEKERKRQKKK